MVNRFPTANHVRISAIPSTPPSAATVADGESGDYSPGQAANFAQAKLWDGVVPCIYCSLSTWDRYKQSIIDLGIHVSAVDWWIAAYPGNGPHVYPGSVGHQFVDRGTYDESVFLDGWQPGRPIHPTSKELEDVTSYVNGTQEHNFWTNPTTGVCTHRWKDNAVTDPNSPAFGWHKEYLPA
jgi:hypothetical protein